MLVILDKRPLTWKDFKNFLRHKAKKFSPENLITNLCIEKKATKFDHKDEVLIVKNNNTENKFTYHALKPTNKPYKNNNFLVKKNHNHNKIENPSRLQN